MMQNKTLSGTLFILLFFVFTAFAQDKTKTAFSLEDVQKYAMDNNRDIKKALMDIDVADKQRWEVTASGLPQIQISGSYQNLVDIPTQLIPGEIFGGEPGSTIPVKFGKPHNASYGISANQLIFSGSYFVGLQASKIYMQLSEESLTRTKLDVKATVTNSYYLVLIAEENRRVLGESLENVRKTGYEIEQMYNEGFTERTDAKQIQITINELENGIRALDQQIGIAYKLLKIQMGLPLDQEVRLTDKLDELLKRLEVQQNLTVEFNPYNNINLKSVLTQEELARLSLKNEKTTFLPTLAAFASMKRDAQRDKFNIFDPSEKWYPTTVVGLQLSWPIFSGGSKIFKWQKAQIELDQARLMREKVEDGLKLQYAQAKSKLESAQDQYINSGNSRDLAKEVYDDTLEKYREGVATSLELTQAHNQYLTSERDYLQAVTDLFNSNTELKKILEIL
jgi:outer membrane protein TolC